MDLNSTQLLSGKHKHVEALAFTLILENQVLKTYDEKNSQYFEDIIF